MKRLTRSGVKQYFCPNPVCGLSFRNQGNLSRHRLDSPGCLMYRLHEEEEDERDTDDSLDDRKPAAWPNEQTEEESDGSIGGFGWNEDNVGDEDANQEEEAQDGEEDENEGPSNSNPDPPTQEEYIPGEEEATKEERVTRNPAFAPDTYAQTTLLKMLNDINAPFHMYKEIMDWGRNAHENGFDFIPKQRTRQGAVNHLRKKFKLDTLKPQQIMVKLPGDDNLEVPVTIFDFTGGLFEMLTDPDLVGDVSLLDVNPNDPFGKYRSRGNRIDCINAGSWYHETHILKCGTDPKKFLVGIIFACDETVLKVGTKAATWPLMFSTTLFSSKLRNQPKAWFPLGYIYDLKILESGNEAQAHQDKHLRFARLHAIFAAVLESFIECQKPEALTDIELTLGGVTKRVDIVVECAFVIGDIQGGDKICCSAPSYNESMRRICRQCDVHGWDCGDSEIKCNKIVQDDIIKLLRAKNFNALDNLNQYHVYSAWFKVSFGACKYGIFSAGCPTEALHSLENGLIKDSITVLIKEMLTKTTSADLDVILKYMARGWNRQHYLTSGTNDNMPRSLFKDGISGLADVTAATQVGKMFAVVIISLTEEGKEFFHGALEGGSKRTNDMREAFQMLLCYWVWLKKDFYWPRGDVKALEAATNAIRTLLAQLHKLLPREAGQGWVKPKYHEQIHVPGDIERNGPPKGSHSGTLECGHKTHVKNPAKNTQRRREVLDWQIACRTNETHVINRAYRYVTARDDVEETQPLPDGFPKNCSKGQVTYTLTQDGRIRGTFNWLSRTNYGAIKQSVMDCLGVVAEKLFRDEDYLSDGTTSDTSFQGYEDQLFPENTIYFNIFTEYRRQQIIFRAHPCYRSGPPFYDWIMVQWTKNRKNKRDRNLTPSHEVDVAYNVDASKKRYYDYAPARIVAFVEVLGKTRLVVESCDIYYKKSSVFTTEWRREINKKTKDPGVHLIDLDSIVRHCLIIPETNDESCNVFHEVWERERWADEFF